MSDKFTGCRYTITKDLTTAQVAGLIRKDLRKEYPTVKASVRTQYYSGGSSIDIRVQECGFNPINPQWDPNDYKKPVEENQRYTERGRQLLKDLECLANQYNRDGSETQIDYFDVRFYLSVEYDRYFSDEYLEKSREHQEISANTTSALLVKAPESPAASVLKIDLKKLTSQQANELRLFLNRTGIMPFTEVI